MVLQADLQHKVASQFPISHRAPLGAVYEHGGTENKRITWKTSFRPNPKRPRENVPRAPRVRERQRSRAELRTLWFLLQGNTGRKVAWVSRNRKIWYMTFFRVIKTIYWEREEQQLNLVTFPNL